MIKEKIKSSINKRLIQLQKEKVLAFEKLPDFELSPPNLEAHGDLSTNVALMLASSLKLPPRRVADLIVSEIAKDLENIVTKVEIAGPGFINFTISPHYYFKELENIFKAGKKFGRSDQGKGKLANVEFVSANPTGPLHIGHGRGAVFGDVVACILSEVGYKVHREYYINDAGNQMATLGRSVLLRMKEMDGEKVDFPSDCYQGNYIRDIAKEIKGKYEKKINKLEESKLIEFCTKYAADLILEGIKTDLDRLGIRFDKYFSERDLYERDEVNASLKFMRKKGLVYDKDEAVWFKSTDYGDDKDRVLIKKDGSFTYFASDIAYHKDKFGRGYSKVIDIWGADHAGYVTRTKASVSALGHDEKDFNVILIQLVNLIRKGELVSMSTRSATYEELGAVLDEVGSDACRYFFLMRSHNAKLDFDMELAKRQAPDNPVYYIQYAHARICSVFSKALEKGVELKSKKVDITRLDLPEELRLAKFLLEYPSVIESAARELEPHHLTFYLYELAQNFQGYYSKGKDDPRYRILQEDPDITNAKLYLLKNIQIVILNGLTLLGISAPQRMSKDEEVA
ncbi:MAG: arginine--tRNA ligase [Pseudomonadota bacterium]